LPGHEANHSLQSNAKLKNSWSYAFTPPYVFVISSLIKDTENFTKKFGLCFIFTLKCVELS
jgi:hypothetical protein